MFQAILVMWFLGWLDEAGRSLCSKQDVPCAPNRTFLVFEAGHSLCCEQEISCVPITNIAHATCWWIRSVVPWFWRIVIRFAQILGGSAEFAKKWHAKFSNSERLKNREGSSEFFNFLTKTIASVRSRRRKHVAANEQKCQKSFPPVHPLSIH